MTNPESLAKLIKEVPELAGEMMPDTDVDYLVAVDFIPSWFYQAVAGNLAEYIGSDDGYSYVWERLPGKWYGWSICPHQDTPETKECPSYFAAVVEAAITVSKTKPVPQPGK